MDIAKRDENRVTSLLGVDHVSYTVPTTVGVNSNTHAVLVEGQEVVPTDSSLNNPSAVLGYDAQGNLETITQTIGVDQYRKTLIYDGTGNLTDISKWIKL